MVFFGAEYVLDLSILKACWGGLRTYKASWKRFPTCIEFFSLNDYTNYFLSNSWLKGKDLQVFCNSYVHVPKFVAWISRHIWKITTSSNDRLFLTLKGSFRSSIYFTFLQQPVFYGHLSGHLKCLLSERDD